jgi:uncharacterized membrane protein
MKRFISLVSAIVLVLALVTPAAAADPMRPFKGSGTTADSISGPGDCPEGASWRYQSSGTSTFSHLGETWVHVSHCTTMTGPTAGSFGPGTITLTAHNGDKLVLRHWGTFVLGMGPQGPYDSTITIHWEVASGTGRFADAYGSGHASAYGVLASGVTSARYWGSIGY